MNLDFVSRRHPGRPALIVEDGATLGYAELHEAVDSLAAYLPSRQLIFIVGDNDLPSILCYLASLASGAVPLLLRAGIEETQLNRLVRTYNPALVFVAIGSNWSTPGCELIRLEGDYGLYRRAGVATAEPDARLALLLATSGSTGSPKLVRLSVENIAANAASIAQYLELTADERSITSLPFNYSYGLSVLNSHLHAGASIVLTKRSLIDGRFWRLVNDHQVTSIAGVPYSYDMLLKLRLDRINMPTIRTLTLAGGRLDPVRVLQISDICRNRGIRFIPMYGQTEATARIAWLPHDEVSRRPQSIGGAIPGGRIWLEDEAGQVITAADHVGELIYAGPNVSMGYAETADDLALGDINQGILRTGDLAAYDEEGFLLICGRLKRFLKIFGIRISLDAVEQLAAEKGFVCAAHGRDDHLIMHVVESPQVRADEIRTHMATALGIHPTSIAVNPLQALPRLSTGKIDYQRLSQQ
ncbi:AMP-binding protein [Paraburkholderia metrosideri]|uniref:2-succinylbenzoate--CoA ligase n=1 Tax=Paraburkholderia metrosideri TaxID=580937 RepID=A0ABN7HW33_9BURK|nr:AMP-binding protein [Paraburkholderia metrosideri]CAD6540335.1 2-succinylbenzoate--CoA ligase [Paraburkholderia metrosideri]